MSNDTVIDALEAPAHGIACDPRYLHCPPSPDRTEWPWDTPSIVCELKRRGLTLANAASLDSAEIFDGTGQRWMNRALRAEAQIRDMQKAAEHFLGRLSHLERVLAAAPSPAVEESGR